MPLVRLQVRNEYGLGKPELYNEVNREDPKAILDGVAVAGLVGILRQLGDLAEFAAEVFHGLQEQVTTTASRSHKLSLRAQRIEAALPPLEKAVLSQTSHLHFAYTAGSDWHTTIRNRQHHFIDNDLPRFIMDSYEECHDPPHLHMLDKFDTGGPGSCLRRYSDPTFFRRVSASPDEVNAIKVRGDKRTRKIKKRRSFPRNREFSRGVPVTTHSGRMHFASPIMNGQSSPTASMADSTFKSDFGDHRGTDYRPGSGYVECIFRASNEMQPDEQESNRSSSSRVMLQEEAADSVSPYEETQVVDYYPPKEISESCITSNSCPVMWDEKTEITEPREQICNEIEDSATISVTPGTGVGEAGNFENVDVSDINLCCDGNTSKPNIHENQIDDIDSEPDNYEDALNTIESEPENDVECQTKREVERHSTSVDIEEIKVALNELTSQASNSHTSRRESDTISFVAPNDGLSTQLPKSASSETYEQADMCQIPQVLSNSVCSPVTKDQNTDLLDGTKLESFDGNSSSRVFTLPHDEVTSSICGDQESSSEHIGVKFWTNGGLLGLEPSKPPDFAASSAQNCNFGMRNNDDHCERNVNMSTENVDSIVDSIESKAGSKCSSPFKISKNGVPADGTRMVSSPADLNCKFGMSEDQRYRSGHPSGDCLRSVSVLAPRIAVPVVPSAKVAHSESVEENSENHGVFGLGHKLLMNSFRRKLSLVNDEEGKSFDTVNASVLEQSYGKHEPSCQKITGRNSLGQFQSVSPTISLPPSPPIEHMKISFHPLNGFETSRLTLKFPHDKNRHESSKDMFTSFQLVPEPAVQLHDFCSDSDDGTFCRSSLYISDDCLSRHSESGSEQWESSETPISEDNGHHGALCSFSPTESTSTSGEHGRMANCKTRADGEHEFLQTENGQQPLLSFSGYAYVPSLDLPSFDSMESVSMEDKDVGCDAKNYDELHHPQTVPLPPPLPPVEQWILKPHLNAEEAQKHTLLEPLNDKPVSKNFVSRIFQQPKQAAALQNHVVEEASEVTLNRKDQQESKTYGEANQGSKVEQMDEKEDFLHQIRTKSFNLRRTGTARSTGAAAQAASVNVTAILEKANAIRQAVGSDDGDENDNWSDT